MVTYYFAKLNINEKILEKDSFDNIKNVLIPTFLLNEASPFKEEQTPYIEKKNNKVTKKIKSIAWKFTDTERVNDKIIKGKITRIVTSRDLDFADLKNSRTVVREHEHLDAVNFFYNSDSELFAYRSTTEIPYGGTPNKIENIFKHNDADGLIGEIKVMLLTKTDEISSRITKGVIKKFQVDLIIPNERHTTDSIADVLSDNGIKNGRLTGENNEGIISTNEKGELTGLMKEVVDLMALGYAKASFWLSENSKTKKRTKVTSQTIAKKKNMKGLNDKEINNLFKD
ncbi:hypothetical protein [Levilactobacillus brevis]|uniref:hypothetical protein n=1 Tax=Levilactobacillus brevis TaxID=1580 RepID=UPI001BDE7C7E|nr:hypothetical protein [Levilactobacillus brevis]